MPYWKAVPEHLCHLGRVYQNTYAMQTVSLLLLNCGYDMSSRLCLRLESDRDQKTIKNPEAVCDLLKVCYICLERRRITKKTSASVACNQFEKLIKYLLDTDLYNEVQTL
jgi:hypothetical protein